MRERSETYACHASYGTNIALAIETNTDWYCIKSIAPLQLTEEKRSQNFQKFAVEIHRCPNRKQYKENIYVVVEKKQRKLEMEGKWRDKWKLYENLKLGD